MAEMGKEPKETTEHFKWKKNSEFSNKIVQFPKQQNFFFSWIDKTSHFSLSLPNEV